MQRRSVLRRAVVLALGFSQFSSFGNPSAKFRVRDRLIVQIGSSFGPIRFKEALVSTGPTSIELSDKSFRFDFAEWLYIGDLKLTFAFNAPDENIVAARHELVKIGFKTPEDALKFAVENLRRLNGSPETKQVSGALMKVESKDSRLNSSYFLDKQFWRNAETQHSGGLLVHPASRESLLFAPLSDKAASNYLQRSYKHTASTTNKPMTSRCLFLFQGGEWRQVFA